MGDPSRGALRLNIPKTHGRITRCFRNQLLAAGSQPLRVVEACSKPECENFGKRGIAIGPHGWFTTKTGRRRRYRCKICGGTLSTNTGTAYKLVDNVVW